jgi:ABC-type transport system involved in multi-copper enzyme maturation permease subunit
MTRLGRSEARKERTMRSLFWFVRKDILFPRHSLFLGLLIAALFPLMVGWYAYKRTPFLRVGGRTIPSAPYFAVDFLNLCAMAILSGIFLIGMKVHTEKVNGSFRVLLALPLSREHLFWARVLTAVLWGTALVTIGYLSVWFMQYRGFFSDDPLIALIAKLDFFALLLALDMLLAVILVGLSLLAGGRFVLVALALSFLTPSLGTKIFLNPMVTGLSEWSVMPVVIEILSRRANLVFLIIALSLLLGFVMSTIFKYKRTHL